MNFTERIKEARATHSIQNVLGTNKRIMVCPLPTHNHKNNTASFSIFWHGGVQLFQCHGNCGQRGDVIDLVGFLRIPGYDPHNIDMLRRALELVDSKYETVELIPQKEATLNGDEWRDYLPVGDEVITYAATRGISEETLKNFRIGQNDNWMTMPAFENRRLVGIKMRNIHPGKNRFIQLAGSHQALFNYDQVNLTSQSVLVVKGEIPCMLLSQNGILACAPTGGEGGGGWRKDWQTALALANVVVVGDNDEPGRKFAPLRAASLHGTVRFPPEKYQDIDKWILADQEKAIAEINRWMVKEDYMKRVDAAVSGA